MSLNHMIGGALTVIVVVLACQATVVHGYDQCGNRGAGFHPTEICGDDPLEIINLPSGLEEQMKLSSQCPKEMRTCMHNKYEVKCFCPDGLYKLSKGVRVYMSWNSSRDDHGRDLSNIFWMDVILDNEVGGVRRYVTEKRPNGGHFRSDNPSMFSYNDDGNDFAGTNHPTVVKGGQFAVEVEGGTAITVFNDLFIKSGASAANAQLRLFCARDNLSAVGDYMSFTVFTPVANALTLSSTNSICNAPCLNLGVSLELSGLASVDVGGTYDPCSTDYLSCSEPFTFYQGASQMNAQTCSGHLYNYNVANRWFATGVSIA